MGNANRCAGSAVYIIDLENNGEIYGAVGRRINKWWTNNNC